MLLGNRDPLYERLDRIERRVLITGEIVVTFGCLGAGWIVSRVVTDLWDWSQTWSGLLGLAVALAAAVFFQRQFNR